MKYLLLIAAFVASIGLAQAANPPAKQANCCGGCCHGKACSQTHK